MSLRSRRKPLWIAIALALVCLSGAGVVAIALHVPDPAIPPALAQRLPDVARGAYVAVLGDCVACHSAPNGQAFAGGVRSRRRSG